MIATVSSSNLRSTMSTIANTPTMATLYSWTRLDVPMTTPRKSMPGNSRSRQINRGETRSLMVSHHPGTCIPFFILFALFFSQRQAYFLRTIWHIIDNHHRPTLGKLQHFHLPNEFCNLAKTLGNSGWTTVQTMRVRGDEMHQSPFEQLFSSALCRSSLHP